MEIISKKIELDKQQQYNWNETISKSYIENY